MPLQEKNPAPEFSIPDEDGVVHNLSDYRGKTVLLYFYPKDNTEGCTLEALHFRDDFKEYMDAGVTILGVSPDSCKSHQKFKTQHDLPFTPLSDEDHKVAELFGVWGRKKFMGREYDGIYRTTFLINPEGIIEKVFENVKPADHSREVLALLKP